MLKGIPAILPPELLKILMEMGHGDELLLADANYPRLGQPERVIRCDGHGIPELMEAILSLMPLDSYVEHPTTFMAVLPNDPYVPEIWDTYRAIGAKHEEQGLREEAIDKYRFFGSHPSSAPEAIGAHIPAIPPSREVRRAPIAPPIKKKI